jgi:hypothetical protein
MCKDSEPVAQRIHRENAERMLLASFVAVLSGELGKQVKFQNPQDLRQALTTALAFREALKQERFAETFYTKFDKSVRLSNQQNDREPAERHSPRRAANHLGARRYASGADRSATSCSTRDVQARTEPRCYDCEGRGQFARECPTKLKRGKTTPPERTIRVNVRTVHARPVTNPVTQEKRQRTKTPGLRETSKRRATTAPTTSTPLEKLSHGPLFQFR